MYTVSIISLALAISAASAAVVKRDGSAQINNYSDSNCQNFEQATTVASAGGHCYAQDSNANVLVASETCPVTVYTDGTCSDNGNIATVGSCRSGISSFSIDC